MHIFANISDTQAQAISGGLRRSPAIKNITQLQQQLEQSNLAVYLPTTGGVMGGFGTSDLFGSGVTLVNNGALTSTIKNTVVR
jgi:hypothetical protein